MSLDAVPSGFSSAAAVTLLKTMRSTQSANSSFIAKPATSPFQASSNAAATADTIFSIIAISTKDKAGASSSTPQVSKQSDQADVDRAEDLEHNDPYWQKSYTINEAAQNFYAMENQTLDALRRSGLTQAGQTNGQVLAARLQFSGQKGADFAAAFDNKTLAVIDPTTLDLDAKETVTYMKSSEGVCGASISMSINQEALLAYEQYRHLNAIWTDGEGYKGGGGLLFTW